MNMTSHPDTKWHDSTQPLTAKPGAGQDVHIDIHSLSLHDFTPAQQQRFLQSLSATLTQMASERQDWSHVSSRHLQSLPPLQTRAGGTPEDSAHQLARQLFERLGADKRERGHG